MFLSEPLAFREILESYHPKILESDLFFSTGNKVSTRRNIEEHTELM